MAPFPTLMVSLLATDLLITLVLVAFSDGTVGLSTRSVSDRHKFTLLAKEFVLESPILADKIGQCDLLPLLLKMLTIVGCVVIIIFSVVVADVVISF